VSLYTTIRIPTAKRGSAAKPQPSVSALSGAKIGTLVDVVRNRGSRPVTSSFDPSKKRPSVSSLSQLFGDFGYGGIMRAIMRPKIEGPVIYKKVGRVITITPKPAATPVFSLEPAKPIERMREVPVVPRKIVPKPSIKIIAAAQPIVHLPAVPTPAAPPPRQNPRRNP